MPAKAPPFAAQGDFYFRGAADYEPHGYQYASSSHTGMQPAVIFYAKDENGIIETVKYAAANKLAMAIRTGGHQYSGASSHIREQHPDRCDWNAGCMGLGSSHRSASSLRELRADGL